MIVVCVLKSGGCYNLSHVVNLQKQLTNTQEGSYKLYCLTDMKVKPIEWGIDFLPLENNYYGWWSKLEMFDVMYPEEKVLYIDLDTIILSDIRHFLDFDGDLLIMEDVYRRNKNYQSSIMVFNRYAAHEINEYVKSCGIKFDKRRPPEFRRGDQQLIQKSFPGASFFQDLFPGEIVSYKVHCCNKEKKFISVPEKAKIISFHGLPRPWDDSVTEVKYYV